MEDDDVCVLVLFPLVVELAVVELPVVELPVAAVVPLVVEEVPEPPPVLVPEQAPRKARAAKVKGQRARGQKSRERMVVLIVSLDGLSSW